MHPRGWLHVWTLRGARSGKRGVMLFLQELSLCACTALLSVQLSVSTREIFVGRTDGRMGGRMEAVPSRHFSPFPLSQVLNS